MNRISVLLTLVCMACFSAYAQNKKDNMKTAKFLVAYFSATGTTAKVAHEIAEVSKGDIYEIVPEKPYTDADLNWNDKKSRSSVEMNDSKARPELKGQKKNMQDYDIVFIGYPVWWNLAPRIINTFIEKHDLKGKVVIPFATSGGSGISNSVNMLKRTYPGLKWMDGKLLNSVNRKMLQNWIDGLK